MPRRIAAPPVNVYLNGKLETDAQVMSCTIGSGADGLPQCEFVIEKAGRTKNRFQVADIALIGFDQALCEVEIIGLANTTVAHAGVVSARQANLSGAGDWFKFQSRLEPHHFGFPLKECYVFNAWAFEPFGADIPTVFNPEVDDVIQANGHGKKRHPRFGFSLFLPPDCTQTETGRSFNGTPAFWTLPEAVYYLCWSLNFEQKLVANPTLAELIAILPNDQNLL